MGYGKEKMKMAKGGMVKAKCGASNPPAQKQKKAKK
jgi:hypothetical protein